MIRDSTKQLGLVYFYSTLIVRLTSCACELIFLFDVTCPSLYPLPMPRRKRVLEDSDDSDSSQENHSINLPEDDPDLREERELFENPYNRKRRRKNTKEDAIYGVFGDDSENEDNYKRGSSNRRTHWTKAPAFVSSEKKVDLDKDEDVAMADGKFSEEEQGEDGEDDGSQGEDAAEVQDDSDHSESSRPPSPRVRLEDEDGYQEDEEPERRISGLGFKPAAAEDNDTNNSGFGFGGIGSRGGIGTRGGIGASGIGAKGGIGARSGIGSKPDVQDETLEERIPIPSFSKGGIGSAKSFASFFASSSTLKTVSLSEHESSASASPAPPPAIPNEETEPPSISSRGSPSPALDGMPTSFGRAQAQTQRFRREAAPSPKPASLSVSEMAHFSKISGTFGARMLSKMGWQAGTGLGVTGEGIVTPVESKLRPQKMGIAFRGFKEKTEQAKREAKRRGEVVSDDEEDEKTKRMRRKMKEAEQKRSDVWKKPKKVKTKIEHKTYEQIIAEAGQEPAATGLGQIIDATGAVVSISLLHCNLEV